MRLLFLFLGMSFVVLMGSDMKLMFMRKMLRSVKLCVMLRLVMCFDL